MSLYATGITMTMDNNYVISAQLTNSEGELIGTEQTIDLPLESVVVSGSYDSQTQSLILTLQNGNTITIPVSGLISGLQAEITAQNPLSADLVTDGTNNKVFTAAEKTKLDGLEVNDATITIQQNGTTVGSFTTNDDTDTTINLTGGGGSQWFGTQAQFDNLGTYDDDTDYYISDKLDYNTDLKNKPDLTVYATKTEVNTKNNQQDTEIAGKLSGHFMTQAEFDALGNNVPEGENYFIQGDTVQMVVTFTDQSTATYNVVVD